MYEVVAADMESLFIRWRPKTFWLFRHQGRDPLDFYPLSVFVVREPRLLTPQDSPLREGYWKPFVCDC